MQVFDLSQTRKQQILVEYLTDTGSAFAVTPHGEQVFLNRRLVEKMNLEGGEVLDAFLLPNYPDKRETIPWRAMRVEFPQQDDKLDVVTENAKAQMKKNRADILQYMQDNGADEDVAVHPMELANQLEMPVEQVKQILDAYPDLFMRVDAYMLQPATSSAIG